MPSHKAKVNPIETLFLYHRRVSCGFTLSIRTLGYLLRLAYRPCQTAQGWWRGDMFKFVWLVGAAALMEHYGVPPPWFAVILAGFVLNFVVDLEKKVGLLDMLKKRVDATTQELSDIKSDISELRRDPVQSGRLDWHLSQRRDDTEFRQIA